MKKILFVIMTLVIIPLCCMSQESKRRIEIGKWRHNIDGIEYGVMRINMEMELPLEPGTLVVYFNNRSIESFWHERGSVSTNLAYAFGGMSAPALSAFFPYDAFDEFNGPVDICYKLGGLPMDTVKNIDLQERIQPFDRLHAAGISAYLTKEKLRDIMVKEILGEMNTWLNEENDEELKELITEIYLKRILRVSEKLDLQ